MKVVLGCCLSFVLCCLTTAAYAQYDRAEQLDSLFEVLEKDKQATPQQLLDAALAIRKANRKYAIESHVYSDIVRYSLATGATEIAERYAQELFPVFQLNRVSREHTSRSIECRNLCFQLYKHYKETDNPARAAHYMRLVLVRFQYRWCGTGAKRDDHRNMKTLSETYSEAGKDVQAKHWQHKTERFERKHLNP